MLTVAALVAVNTSCKSSGTTSTRRNETTLTRAATIDTTSENALLTALDDERRAEALYSAVISRFGDVRPFSNIVHAEVRHQSLLLPLMEKYGVPTPANPYDSAAITAPGTLAEACAMGAEAERDNIAIYDRLIPTIQQEDIRSAFETLRSASADRHLPAFERCVDCRPGPRRGNS
jgi:hypothetical protein